MVCNFENLILKNLRLIKDQKLKNLLRLRLKTNK